MQDLYEGAKSKHPPLALRVLRVCWKSAQHVQSDGQVASMKASSTHKLLVGIHRYNSCGPLSLWDGLD
jgi:hypothetical protein